MYYYLNNNSIMLLLDSINASISLRNAVIKLERLSLPEKDLNDTSAAHSGASEILDLIGDSWMNDSIDSARCNKNIFDSTHLNGCKESFSTYECGKQEWNKINQISLCLPSFAISIIY